MNYKIQTPEFEGPLDLLLHLIKQDNIDIKDICIEKITKQYLECIRKMEEMNLNIASEYLVLAAELIEIKASSLLPRKEQNTDEEEEDTKENLIRRLIEYEQYKKITNDLKKLEEYRHEIFTKEPDSLIEYNEENNQIDFGVNIQDLLNAFSKLMAQKELEKPLNTKITTKEYSIYKRCNEIKKILKQKQKIDFTELFEDYSKEYIVVTFLAILSMSRKHEIEIEQESNFKNIIIKETGEY